MNSKLVKIYEKLKQDGLTAEQEQKILAELNADGSHDLPDAASGGQGGLGPVTKQIYRYNDLFDLRHLAGCFQTDLPASQHRHPNADHLSGAHMAMGSGRSLQQGLKVIHMIILFDSVMTFLT